MKQAQTTLILGWFFVLDKYFKRCMIESEMFVVQIIQRVRREKTFYSQFTKSIRKRKDRGLLITLKKWREYQGKKRGNGSIIVWSFFIKNGGVKSGNADTVL
jgi:hypothetical protein